MSQEKTRLTISELNQMYLDGESCDSDLFAEQRSNILLIAGDHYTKKQSRFWSRVRDAKDLTHEQKIRLTKNHIQRITKTLRGNILQYAPGVTVAPKNENELKDQKVAQMHLAVWQDLKDRHNLRAHIRSWAQDFVDIGEVFVKVTFDPNAGDLLGYEQATDEMGNPLFDETGQPVSSEQPVFRGDIQFERVFGFNILRDPAAKSFSEARWVCERKMVDTKDLQKLVSDDEEKAKLVETNPDETYKVFDAARGQYQDAKGQTMLREYYLRPCPMYPKGYYFITTSKGILFEGELPDGVFPIVQAGYDDIPTSARARGIVKQLRPYQAEVNRSASKIAETQITLGDDKVLMQAGSKLAPGANLPGVRSMTFTGMTPVVMAGRSGEQYLAYMQSQIQEMYEVANVKDDSVDQGQQVDVYTQLFQSIRNKKKFSIYAEKFEDFLTDVCRTALKLAKLYYTDQNLVPAIGAPEFINIPEFKSTDDISYQIKLEAQSEDMETKLGKQLSMNHILQYVGPNLSKEDIGKIIRAMPYSNGEEAFNDMTLDYDNATADILALDRGEYPAVNPYDDHDYMLKRLAKRMKQRDFQFLSPQVQGLYAKKKNEHMAFQRAQLEATQAAQAGFIPTDGYLVTIDFYVSDPKDPAKVRRARVPYSAVVWLLKRLEQQGLTQQALQGMNEQMLAEMSQQLGAPQGPAGDPFSQAVPQAS